MGPSGATFSNFGVKVHKTTLFYNFWCETQLLTKIHHLGRLALLYGLTTWHNGDATIGLYMINRQYFYNMDSSLIHDLLLTGEFHSRRDPSDDGQEEEHP